MADFDIGDKVKHKVFGEGAITDIAEGNSANLTIAFEDGKKVIKSSFVKLLKQMRTGLSLLIAWLFGDKVNPIYIFIGMYALSGVVIYFFWKWKKSKTK